MVEKKSMNGISKPNKKREAIEEFNMVHDVLVNKIRDLQREFQRQEVRERTLSLKNFKPVKEKLGKQGLNKRRASLLKPQEEELKKGVLKIQRMDHMKLTDNALSKSAKNTYIFSKLEKKITNLYDLIGVKIQLDHKGVDLMDTIKDASHLNIASVANIKLAQRKKGGAQTKN